MWFRGNDKFHSNPKVRKVRRSHPTKRKDASAAGVWWQAASWSADHQMNGFCPEEILETFDDDWESIVERLVAAVGPSGEGLFVPGTYDGEPGYFVHDFLEFNDSREKQHADALAARTRVALYRDKELIAAITERDQDRCRYCGTRVQWNDRRGSSGGTYDHVKPISHGGRNTLDNVVTCCRRCNRKKSDLTLAEAGMRKLPPGSLGAPQLDEPGAPGNSEVNDRNGTGRDGARNVPSTDPATDTPGDLNDEDGDQ